MDISRSSAQRIAKHDLIGWKSTNACQGYCHSTYGATLLSKVDLNELRGNITNEIALICAKIGADLTNTSKITSRKTKSFCFAAPCTSPAAYFSYLFNTSKRTIVHTNKHIARSIRYDSKAHLLKFLYRCLHGQAPRYLADHITPAIQVASRHRLRSANRHRLIVPRCRLNTYGRRAFPVAGPTFWNSLPCRWIQRSGVWCRQLQTVL